MYKDKKYRVRRLREILDDIRMAKDYYGDVEKVFLCDGDAIAIETETLLQILQALYATFPSLRHVGSYVGPQSTLTKSPDELTILEVVNAVEPIQRIRTCPLGLASHGVRLCPLHKRLDNALAMVEEAFGSSTLAEVLAEPTRSKPLCPFPIAKIEAKS